MKTFLHRRRRKAGFTLTEVISGTAIASILLAALMAGSIAIHRSFAASERLARAKGDLLRVADYMARDLRNATSVNTTPQSPSLLSLTVGDYYNQNGTASNPTDDVPNAPVLGRYGATYGAAPLTVRYVRAGTRIGREVTRVEAGISKVSTTWIADNVNALTVAVDSEGTVTFRSEAGTSFKWQKPDAQATTLPYVMASKPRNLAP
jgi:prepilin-type N-terminal cleavage/methylation domain-containing protein